MYVHIRGLDSDPTCPLHLHVVPRGPGFNLQVTTLKCQRHEDKVTDSEPSPRHWDSRLGSGEISASSASPEALPHQMQNSTKVPGFLVWPTPVHVRIMVQSKAGHRPSRQVGAESCCTSSNGVIPLCTFP